VTGVLAPVRRLLPSPSASAPSVSWARVRLFGVHALGVVLLIAAWEVAARAGLANGFVLGPADAVAAVLDPATLPRSLRAASVTFGAAATGLLIGGLLAAVSALVAHQVRPLRRVVDQIAALANSAPWVAIGPVVLVVAGRDSGPVAIAALAVYFPIFVAVSVGLASSEGSLRELFLSTGASRRRTVAYLTLPRALPSIVEGLKIAAPAAIAGTIYGEWYGSTTGLGILLISGMQAGNVTLLWSASLLAAAGGLLSYGVAGAAHALLRRRYGAAIGLPPAPVETWRRRVARTAVEVVVLTALFVGVWQTWITVAGISPLVAPQPLTVWNDLVARPLDYLALVGQTLTTAALALLLGTAVGMALAALARVSSFAQGIVVPGMVLLTATPLVAMFPLLARLLGYGGGTVVVIAAVLVVLPIFVYTRSGLGAATEAHLDLARSWGASRAAVLRWVVLPSALPHISTGIRIAASSAIIATVVGESLIGTTGLGVDFTYQYRLFNMAPAFGSAVLIVVLSLLVFTVFGGIDRLVHRRWGQPRPSGES
jgi:sulfonate transport system permease protein